MTPDSDFRLTNFEVENMIQPTVSWPVCLGVNQHLGPQDQIFVAVRQFAGLLIWGALTLERMGRSFTIAVGPRQRSQSQVRVPRY
jgi:hypothetical protein